MFRRSLGKIRIVELCESVAGPFCTKLLADLGCQVVKVERPGSGDEARRRGPFPGVPNSEASGLFLYVNTNKLGITLDPETKKGQKLLKELLSKADILVEDRTRKYLKDTGLDYASLEKSHPHLVVASVTPFGRTGPRADYKTQYLNTFHNGGEGYTTPIGSAFPDRPPINAARFLGEYEAGIMAAGGVITAYYHKMMTGQGQHIDFSKQEALMVLNQWDTHRFANDGLFTTRLTRGYRSAGVLPCKDGYVEFAYYGENEWRGLVEILQNEKLMNDERFKTRKSRDENGEEVMKLLRESLSRYTKEEIVKLAQSKGVPLGPYRRIDEAANSAQARYRKFFVNIKHPVAGSLKYPSAPYIFAPDFRMERKPAPLLGQHNELVYGDWLGYSRQDMVKLREANII